MKFLHLSAVVLAIVTGPLRAGTLTVGFNNGSPAPLVQSYGPNDNPAQANAAYTVNYTNGRAVYVAPAAAVGPRLTGFLDLPAAMTPVSGDLTIEWTFPVVSELLALGGGSVTASAIAGCYIRGAIGAWTGGQFGDYWFGYVVTNGVRASAIRQGNDNLVTEPFTATSTVSYRVLKTNGTRLALQARYDGGAWHDVGSTVLTVTAGNTDAVAVTHVRVLDTSGAAISVSADDFSWTGPGLVSPDNTATKLINLSCRARVGTGGDILIPGLVISGTAPKTLLVRGVGPTLASFGVTGELADPNLTVFSGSSAIATNNDWSSGPNTAALVAAASETGAFALPNGSRDAALIVTLNPGSYTVQVAGVGGTTGVALVEIYELP